MAEQRKYSPNYNWALPLPQGNQIVEIKQIGDTISDIDASFKTFVDAYNAHKHKFRDIEELPTTLEGYGITDAMTTDQVGSAISESGNTLSQSFAQALSSLSDTITKALGLRVRVDEAQEFSLAQKKRARDNIEAVGAVDKGAAGGVAPLGTDGKVASTYLPALTTTATVGAAMAGANGKETPADGDFFGGVLAGSSTMFKTTWANIKATLKSYFDTIYYVRSLVYTKTEVNNIVAGNMSGRAYPRRVGGGALNFNWTGKGGTPTWLWGWKAEDGAEAQDMFVYNPANFNVGSVGGWNIQAILDRIESRAAAFADDRANRKARKCAGWDQWNFTSHDQRAQNGTGENIYYTARITGTYADTVQLQVSPNNVDFWTVGTTTAAGNSTNLEYTSGCLPPGWWMRLIRGSGNYNANVILIW